MDMPCRAFYEGVNPKTILNNCHHCASNAIGYYSGNFSSIKNLVFIK